MKARSIRQNAEVAARTGITLALAMLCSCGVQSSSDPLVLEKEDALMKPHESGPIGADREMDTRSSSSRLGLTITYPTENADLGGFGSATIVTGYVTKLSSKDIAALEVNGVPADLTYGERLWWAASIPIKQNAESTATVTLETRAGQKVSRSVQFGNFVGLLTITDGEWSSSAARWVVADPRKGLFLADPRTASSVPLAVAEEGDTPLGFQAIALDDHAGRVFSLLALSRVVLSVELETGKRWEIGEVIDSQVGDIVFEADGNRLLYTGRTGAAVYAMDLETGDSEELSGPNVGQGDPFEAPWGIDYAPSTGFAYVTDAQRGAVVQVDLETGNRTVISNEATGANSFGSTFLTGIVVSGSLGFVADATENSLYAVELSSGDKTLIASSLLGDGSTLVQPGLLSKGREKGSIVVAGRNSTPHRALVTVDADTGERAAVVSNTNARAGFGVEPTSVFGLVLDERGDRLVVASWPQHYSISLSDGERSVVDTAGQTLGSFPTFGSESTRIYSSRSEDWSSLYTLDLSTQLVTVLTGESQGTGPVFYRPNDITYYASDDSLLAVVRATERDVRGPGVIRVSLDSGNRVIVSDAEVGEGPSFQSASEIAIDLSSGHYYVLDDSALVLLAVNPKTGDRSVVSGDGVGTGDPLFGIKDLVVSHDGSTLYGLDWLYGRVVAINVVTGDRTVFADLESLTWLGSWSAESLIYRPGRRQFLVGDAYNSSVLLVDEDSRETSLISF